MTPTTSTRSSPHNSLDRHHEVGGDKARLFLLVLGITAEDDLGYLSSAILVGVREQPVVAVRPNPPWGVNCNVLIPVRGVRDRGDRQADVLTSWQLRYEGDRPRLVTAYVD
jgi:hypothetical protein